MIPRVKICGLRRVEDARHALARGATHLGCVLAADSPRCATLDEVRAIADLAAARPLVLVFRSAPVAEILAACIDTGVRRVQVHGASGDLVEALAGEGCLVHRVQRIDPHTTELRPFVPPPDEAVPALLDVAGGGSGTAFDWTLLGACAPHATFIAGGITPANLAALLPHRPWGIDLSSGIERAPGIKDRDALDRLFTLLENSR